MKIRLISTLVAACAITASAHAQVLHPADRYDIKSEAEFAVRDVTIKAGEPVAAQSGYIVPVIVANEKCKVLVRPYTPKSDMEPPRRWKADTAVCGK
ncbi:hypothetical protein LGM85_22560 [Burkholderia multivorans]|uniref:hypothetical protein n=1 Tax=Burkholderia multivorans TaxID=87883 RepID=UPI00158E5809|nr:hypothetical protein [Burkholderia multivorans]MBU9371809.1 hypothetical protein [Burkholderia multivorans]MBY4672297.1 hypothetical protein [Burkholderia multivorans]MCA8486718.1 hypothetical protein [Burkholderia multivorans]